jgi:2-polyprenyl-3-methyl-5-hydroxy-6-metoxy-1,4-benzoquinol methylase
MEFTGERFIPGQGGAIELEHLNRYYFVVHQIDLKGKTVLDIASGEGYGSNIIAKHASKVIGVDISFEAIEHAKNKYKVNNLEFLWGSVVDIPLEDNSVDVAVSFETIEHHDKHHEMLKEIKRILTNQGIIVISSPNKNHFLNSEENKFHVKELFYQEFEDLIKQYFKSTLFFSQSIFTGSIIALDDNNHDYHKPVIVNSTGNIEPIKSKYNIAIGADSENLSIKYPIISYGNEQNTFFEEDIKRKLVSYRVGKLANKVLKLIRKFLKASI